MSIKNLSLLFSLLLISMLSGATLLAWSLYLSFQELVIVDTQFRHLRELGNELRFDSMNLTRSVREYIVTGDPVYKRRFFRILGTRSGAMPRDVTRIVAPGESVPMLTLFGRYGATQDELRMLERALHMSDALAEREKSAMHIVDEARHRAPGTEWRPNTHLLHLVYDAVYQERAQQIQRELVLFFDKQHARVDADIAARKARVLSRLTMLFGCITGILALAVLWTCYAMSRICGPLETTTAFARAVAAGDLSANIEVRSQNEIGELRRVLNAMTTNLRVYTENLRNLSNVDPLTGIWNRRFILNASCREILRAQRYGSTLALALVDIDRFKQINDGYGHEFGDTLLKRFTGLVLSCIRKTDTFARFGGDEFLLLMLEIDEPRLRDKLEQLRRCCEDAAIAHEDGTLRFTISLGGALYTGSDATAQTGNTPEDTLNELLRRADAALYRSKALGRNAATLWQPGLEGEVPEPAPGPAQA